ncbi:hypothetical protein KY290_037376 [Solanum tuberosum]|uniref:Uncharacterized protein n=1 Tax=Solanum tuberosum TaxID=4113 RepID=A0ABQ7TVB4_SOLTU|nr:hypothetical protein KY284_036712 [Solanum tuberosum]KAH0738671.1 hypothetical protein KY290_037376 [Solanum tuberosum]
MRPTRSTDKGKGVASASDSYAQTVLSNMKFRPQTPSIEMMDRMYFVCVRQTSEMLSRPSYVLR